MPNITDNLKSDTLKADKVDINIIDNTPATLPQTDLTQTDLAQTDLAQTDLAQTKTSADNLDNARVDATDINDDSKALSTQIEPTATVASDKSLTYTYDKAIITPAYATATPSLLKRPPLIANRGMALFWYILSLIIIGLDQWTKWLAVNLLDLHKPVPVIPPVLNWTLAYNEGAAWSILADQGGWQKWFFAIISIVMSVFFIIYLFKAPRQAKWLNIGLAMILGGAIGNLIDRVRLGKVVDFIHVHYADAWHYPIFNIADMAICVGLVIVLIDMLFLESKRNVKYRS